jgi:hypothetical protein
VTAISRIRQTWTLKRHDELLIDGTAAERYVALTGRTDGSLVVLRHPPSFSPYLRDGAEAHLKISGKPLL